MLWGGWLHSTLGFWDVAGVAGMRVELESGCNLCKETCKARSTANLAKPWWGVQSPLEQTPLQQVCWSTTINRSLRSDNKISRQLNLRIHTIIVMASWNNHKGGTVTGGYGFGYVSDMYPKPVLIRIRFPFWYRKYRERPLKRAPNTALRLTHVRERKLAVPPFRLFRAFPKKKQRFLDDFPLCPPPPKIPPSKTQIFIFIVLLPSLN